MRLGATYDVHLRLIGKLVGDFLLVITELFSLGAFVLSQYTRLTDGQTKSRQQYSAYASQSHGKNLHRISQRCTVSTLHSGLATFSRNLSRTVPYETPTTNRDGLLHRDDGIRMPGPSGTGWERVTSCWE